MQKEDMDVLLDLLQELSSKFELSTTERDYFYSEFRKIYSNVEFRHSYAELSHFAEEKITPDSREELVAKLDLLLAYADENFHENDDKRTIKGVGKLADHLELETLRLARIEQIKIISDKVSLEKLQTEVLIRDNVEKIQNQQDDIKNMNTQMVSVLGIFSAVVLAFFGGMSYFTSVFSNLNNIPLHKLLIIASILGLVICDSIYTLLNFIFLIIRQDKMRQNKVLMNFPILAVNITLIIILFLGIMMWISNFDSEASSEIHSTSSIVMEEN